MQWTAGTLSGATHHFLSPQNQIPWAMPWQTSSNPPGSRRKLLLKPPPLAAALIPAGCWQDTQVWEPASLPGLAWKLRALITACAQTARASTAGSFLALFRTDVEHSSVQKQKKKKREPMLTAPRDQTLLFQSTHFGGREAGDHLAI